MRRSRRKYKKRNLVSSKKRKKRRASTDDISKITAWIKQDMRKLWLYYWEPRKTALKRQMFAGAFVCEKCGKVHKKVDVDHVEPVGKTQSLDTYLYRLYCLEDNYQVLCKDCHKEKTSTDRNQMRTQDSSTL